MKKLLPYIVAIVLLIALIVTIPFLLQTDKRRQQLAADLSQRLHRKVVIGKMDIGLFPPALHLKDVAIFGKDQMANPDLQIDQVQASLSLGDLFSSTVHPGSVTLDHWSWTFHRRPDGHWDVDDWLDAFSNTGAAGTPMLHQLMLHSGEIHWMDSYAPIPQELLMQTVDGAADRDHQTLQISGSLTGAVIPVAFAFQGHGRFLSGTWNGDLKCTDESRVWALHIDDASGRMAVTGQSAQWRWDNAFALFKFYGRLPVNVAAATTPAYLQNWQTNFNVEGSSATFSETSTLSGGVTEATLHSLPQASGVRLQATGALKDIPMAVLCAPAGGCASLEGSLTSMVPRFEMVIGSQTWSSWNGEASIDIKDGRYHLPDASIQKLSRVHLLKYVKKKFPGFPEQGLVFAHFKAHGVMTGGQLAIDRALLDAGDLQAGLVGKVDPAHKGIDATMRLQIRERAPSLLELIPGKYIIGETGHEQIQPIFGHLQGTSDEWGLRAVPNYKVSAALKSQLQKALSDK